MGRGDHQPRRTSSVWVQNASRSAESACSKLTRSCPIPSRSYANFALAPRCCCPRHACSFALKAITRGIPAKYGYTGTREYPRVVSHMWLRTFASLNGILPPPSPGAKGRSEGRGCCHGGSTENILLYHRFLEAWIIVT